MPFPSYALEWPELLAAFKGLDIQKSASSEDVKRDAAQFIQNLLTVNGETSWKIQDISGKGFILKLAGAKNATGKVSPKSHLPYDAKLVPKGSESEMSLGIRSGEDQESIIIEVNDHLQFQLIDENGREKILKSIPFYMFWIKPMVKSAFNRMEASETSKKMMIKEVVFQYDTATSTVVTKAIRSNDTQLEQESIDLIKKASGQIDMAPSVGHFTCMMLGGVVPDLPLADAKIINKLLGRQMKDGTKDDGRISWDFQ